MEIKEILIELCVAVITVVVPILTRYLILVIKNMAESAAADAEDVKVQGYILEIAQAITDAVSYTNQTYVDALKASGGFTKEAQLEALQKALDTAKASLSGSAVQFINEVYGDLTEYLTPKIEAAVRAQKLQTSPTGTTE